MAGGKEVERWEKMIIQSEKIQFKLATKLCLESVLRKQLYKLMCGKDNQQTSGKLVDFLIHHVKITMRYHSVDNKWMKLLDDSVELMKQLLALLLKKFIHPLCPKENKVLFPTIRPMRLRRQFGVTDMLQTLKNIFCDPDVIRGYGKELQRRRGNTFTAWAIEVFGEAWCCLVDNEWN